MDKPTREPILRISDLDTLKIVIDPLRLQILEVLDPAPQTINYVAERLGLASSRLYYHFNQLESHGLIRVVETRMVNNIVEKIFWTTAEEMSVDKDLIKYSSEEGPEHLSRLINSMLDTIREDMFRSLEAMKFNKESHGEEEHSEFYMSKLQKRISNETYLEYREKLIVVLEEFGKLPEAVEDDPEAKVVNLASFLYPSHYYNQNKQDEERE